MTYNELFAAIYVNYGKKSFRDGPALLELVKEVDPDMPVSQFTVIDYLTRQNNINTLMAARFQDAAQQDRVISRICREMKENFFVPEDQTRACAQGFLSVFQHGSREDLNRLESEYDESMAPTMVMDPITLNDLEAAPALAETRAPLLQEETITSWPDSEMDLLSTPKVEIPDELPIPRRKDVTEEIDLQDDSVLEELDAGKTQEITGSLRSVPEARKEEEPEPPKKAYRTVPSEESEEDEKDKRAGKISNIILSILLILLLVCVIALFLVLRSMGIF